MEKETINEDDVIHFQFSHQPNDSIGLGNVHIFRVRVHDDRIERALNHFNVINLMTNVAVNGKKNKRMTK